jgi:hypothetical protein
MSQSLSSMNLPVPAPSKAGTWLDKLRATVRSINLVFIQRVFSEHRGNFFRMKFEKSHQHPTMEPSNVSMMTEITVSYPKPTHLTLSLNPHTMKVVAALHISFTGNIERFFLQEHREQRDIISYLEKLRGSRRSSHSMWKYFSTYRTEPISSTSRKRHVLH